MRRITQNVIVCVDYEIITKAGIVTGTKRTDFGKDPNVKLHLELLLSPLH